MLGELPPPVLKGNRGQGSRSLPCTLAVVNLSFLHIYCLSSRFLNAERHTQNKMFFVVEKAEANSVSDESFKIFTLFFRIVFCSEVFHEKLQK